MAGAKALEAKPKGELSLRGKRRVSAVMIALAWAMMALDLAILLSHAPWWARLGMLCVGVFTLCSAYSIKGLLKNIEGGEGEAALMRIAQRCPKAADRAREARASGRELIALDLQGALKDLRASIAPAGPERAELLMMGKQALRRACRARHHLLGEE